MRRVTGVFILLVGGTLVALAEQPVVQSLREQLKIGRSLLEGALAEVEDHQAQLEEAWTRVERESADLLRAQRQEESLESLRLRDSDLREAESELLMHVFALQRLRRELLSGRAEIEATELEIRELEARVGTVDDPLTGTWEIVVEPGGQDGYMYLQLEGTLVQGTYQLAGDWSGSLRGTFVSNKVRLERIDSQIGFAAIFHGQLRMRGDSARLQGSWEATQLAAGMPSGGTWVADRLEEPTGE